MMPDRQCADVEAYFAVDDDEGNQSEEGDDFFHIENGEEPMKEVLSEPLAVVQKSPISNVSVLESNLIACRKIEVGNCEEGWKSFKRPSGEWCMKVFYENWLNQPEAEKKCQEQKATLSGFQNQLELQYATATATSHLQPYTGSVWIGIKRLERCLNSKLTKNCTTLNSFEWTDKSATGSDGMLWTWGQPANVGGDQNCAILTTGYTGYLQYFQVGTFDDVGCDIRYKDTTRGVRGYVCGKPAKH